MNEDGTVKGYNITGRKQWISNGGVADLYTILAAMRRAARLVVRRGEGCAEGFTARTSRRTSTASAPATPPHSSWKMSTLMPTA
jgi:alkylation response protein AidB-like acyl-CoA dehydrogenase